MMMTRALIPLLHLSLGLHPLEGISLLPLTSVTQVTPVTQVAQVTPLGGTGD